MKSKLKIFFLIIFVSSLAFTPNANALLNENCTVSVLNRTAQVKADGTWSLPNIPTNMGPVRFRATCIENGITHSGQTGWILVPPNGVIKVGDIPLGDISYPPENIIINSPSTTLTAIGADMQIQVGAVYPDGTAINVTPATEGTVYTTSNPAIATVSPDGLVTSTGIGRALISVSNEAVLSSLLLTMSDGLNPDIDGDGLPDAWELLNGLNPNDPIDALEDADQDGLSNLDEYNLGTEINIADTDGDGINDGEEVVAGQDGFITNPLLADSDGDGINDNLEVMSGSDPTDAASVNLGGALDRIEISPQVFTITFNSIYTEASKQITVTGFLLDGTEIDLTSTNRGTIYTSSDINIASFGVVDGQVFAGADGITTIQASNSGFTATASVTVTSFSPTALSFISIPGFANNVDVLGNFAYVAAGSAGLQVVDVSDPVNPFIVGSVATPGNANDVKVYGNYAYVADDISGLQIVDVSAPNLPIIIGSIDTPGNAWDVVVKNTVAFIADYNSGLQIIDVSDPSAPAIIGSVDTPGDANGVDVAGNIAVVSDRSAVQIIDISNPLNPVIAGSVSTGDSRSVYIKESIAYVPNYGFNFTDSLLAIDFSNPANPIITGQGTNSVLTDIAGYGGFGFGSEQFRSTSIPIYSLKIPGQPQFQTLLNFSPTRRHGYGIAANLTYVYMTAGDSIAEKGSNGNTRLYIGQYQTFIDEAGIAPTVSITSPTNGGVAYEEQTLSITATATDDVEVEFVSFTINNEVLFTDDTAPYQFDYSVPVGAGSLVLGATATDFGGNEGYAEPVVLSVTRDTSPPTITITSPATGSAFDGAVTVPVTANASDNQGVSAVEFYVDGQLKFTDYVAPYIYEFLVPFTGNAGTRYVITARAIDPVGYFAEDSIEIVKASGNTWLNKIELRIDPSKIDEDMTDFPVLVHLSANSGFSGTDVTQVFTELQADVNRKKIAVTTIDGTICYVEIESWDTVNQEAWLWVKAPFVSSTEATRLNLYYDVTKADMTAFVGDTGEVAANQVWDNDFKGVWHMAQDPTGVAPQILDSTANKNHGTAKGGMTPAASPVGQQGKALNFDGNDYLEITHNPTLEPGNRSISISTWLNFSTVSGIQRFIWKNDGSQNFYGYYFMLYSQSFVFGVGNGAATQPLAGSPSVGNSYHVVGVKDINTGTVRLYMNGALLLEVNDVTDNINYPGNLAIGSRFGGEPFIGAMDETRISNTARSSAWIKASYESGTDNLLQYVTFDAADTTPPTVSITSPANGSAIPGGITFEIAANATDDQAVYSVDFYVDGLLKHNDYIAPYSYNFPVPPFNGAEIQSSITVRATDTNGNFAEDSIQVTNSAFDILSITNQISANDFTYDGQQLAVSGGTLTIDGAHSFQSITLANGAVLTHSDATSTTESFVDLNIAGTLFIDSTSSIDVTGKGYLGGYSGDNGSIYGRTIGNTNTGGSVNTSAASYGGLGGKYIPLNLQVNPVYGSLYNPNDLGSGGGGRDPINYGGDGGGLVRITVGNIILDGAIKSDGGDGVYHSNGGGSGGGIYINTGILSGTGIISATGGKKTIAYPYTGGGGGGRIAIYYDDISGFDKLNILANGGVGSSYNGGAGTIYIKSSAQLYGDLIVDNNNISTVGFSTPLISVGTGSSINLSLNMLTDTARNWRSGDLFGIYLNPDINQLNVPPIVFSILSNDATSITVDNSLYNLTDIASLGDTYIGELYFDNLSVINNAAVETLDNIFYSTLDLTGGLLQAGNY